MPKSVYSQRQTAHNIIRRRPRYIDGWSDTWAWDKSFAVVYIHVTLFANPCSATHELIIMPIKAYRRQLAVVKCGH